MVKFITILLDTIMWLDMKIINTTEKQLDSIKKFLDIK